MSRDLVRSALTSEWQTRKQIAAKCGLSPYGVKKFLGPLLESGEAQKMVTNLGEVLFRKA